MKVEAQLKYRGENFEVAINGKTYAGFCSWSYEEEEGKDYPVPKYPVAIEAETVSRVGIGALLRLTEKRKKEIAKVVAKTLTENEPGSEYVAFYKGTRL